LDKTQFCFSDLPDLITPRHLIDAGFPGGKNQIYALFARQDFPAVRHGKKFLVSKAALMQYFRAAS